MKVKDDQAKKGEQNIRHTVKAASLPGTLTCLSKSSKSKRNPALKIKVVILKTLNEKPNMLVTRVPISVWDIRVIPGQSEK